MYIDTSIMSLSAQRCLRNFAKDLFLTERGCDKSIIFLINIFIWLGGWANVPEEEKTGVNEDQEEELGETQKKVHEQNQEKPNEGENETQEETESENEDVDSDEQNLQTPDAYPVTCSKSKKKKVKNTCNKCLRNFRTPAGLKRHKCNQYKGDNTKQHECSHCDKSFTKPGQLKVCYSVKIRISNNLSQLQSKQTWQRWNWSSPKMISYYSQ